MQRQFQTIVAYFLAFAALALNGTVAGAPDSDSSTVAEIVADKNLDALEFRGRVLDASGKPSAKSRVSIVCVFGGNVGYEELKLIAGEDGDVRFRVRIEPSQLGPLYLSAENPDGSQIGVVRFPRHQPPRSFVCRLAPCRNVTVTVEDRAGMAVESARAAIALNWPAQPLVADTDAAGRAHLRVPASEPIWLTAAWKAYLGFGLSRVSMADNIVKVTLDGASPLAIQVVDEDQRPVEVADLFPSRLGKPFERFNFVVGMFAPQFRERTNATGSATIPWWPVRQESPAFIEAYSAEFVRERFEYDPIKGAGRLKIALKRLVPIRGTVRRADGKPAKGITVIVQGADYKRHSDQTTVSDANGGYELKVEPDQIYLVIALGKRLAAAPQTGFAVRPRTPIEGRDFTLRPATRVHGSLVNKSTQQPVAGQTVYVSQFGLALNDLKDVALLNPKSSSNFIRASHEFSARTDALGRFEFFLGDGTFEIRPPERSVTHKSQKLTKKFQIAGEAERELTVMTDIQP